MRVQLKPLILAALVAAPLATAAEPLTREQGDSILQELRGIRQLLERQGTTPQPQPKAAQAPQTGRVSIKEAPLLGRADAPVALVMFTDHECPYCRKFLTDTLPALRHDYIETGKVKLVMRDLPLDFHANAKKAAEAIHCTGEQGKFWAMLLKFAVTQEPLTLDVVRRLGSESGVDLKGLEACVAAGRYVQRISDSAAQARQLGITGTPTFIVGPEKNGVVEGERVVGALPYDTFKRKLDEQLEKRPD